VTRRRTNLLRSCIRPLPPALSGFNTIKVICVKNIVVHFILTLQVGLVGYGEQVKLEREPQNQYDR
jgi:hypothetical protein